MLTEEIMQLAPTTPVSQPTTQHDEWDDEINAAAVAGKFDELAAQALAEYRAGKTLKF